MISLASLRSQLGRGANCPTDSHFKFNWQPDCGTPAVGRSVWQAGRDFRVVGDGPLNRRPDGRPEGVCSLVYRIEHLALRRRLVLKVMLASGEDPQTAGQANVTTLLASVMARRNAQEVVLPQLAPHLHVVPVLHHYVGDMAPFLRDVPAVFRRDMGRSTLCLVMPEFDMSGGRLVEAVAEHSAGWVGEAKAVKLLMQLLLAVRHMLQQGLAHCDITPDNVLLDRATWHVVLSDFGEAQWLLRPDGRPRTLAARAQLGGGNLMTIAQERMRLHRVPEARLEVEAGSMLDLFGKADAFACGCTLFAILLGDTDGTRFCNTGRPYTLDEVPALPAGAYSPAFRAVLRQLVAHAPAERLGASEAVLMLGLLLWRRGVVGEARQMPADAAALAGGEWSGEEDEVDEALRVQFAQVAREMEAEAGRAAVHGLLERVATRVQALTAGLARQ